MIKFVKCTYDQYQYIWLRERVQNFLVTHYSVNSKIDELVDQFLSLNQNEDREAVKTLIIQILNKN